VFEDTASVLFGMEGLRVTDAEPGPDGTVTVWAVTDHRDAARCPDCGTVSSRVHEQVVTCPEDVRCSAGRVRLCWVKRRWKCQGKRCRRKTFTESVPQVPPRCQVTGRLREQAGAEVAGRGITPAEAARHAGVSWPVAHSAFAEMADPVLERPHRLVAHLGIDEHRRGRCRYAADPVTGEYELVTDRWHTCFYDLSGDQGLLGQVEGRTADDAAYWLAGQPPAWRDAVRVVATGMCSVYASAVRRMLPDAVLVIGLFHVVQLAVKVTGDVRRRRPARNTAGGAAPATRNTGSSGCPARTWKPSARPGSARSRAPLNAGRHGQQAAAAWIGRELLRDALNLRARVSGSTPCERNVRGRLFRFYDWCARHDDIPALLALARTIARWEDQITAAVITGVTNAKSESLNRIARLEARNACSFRNAASQRRRVRTACNRAARRPSRTAATRTATRLHGASPQVRKE
jgi:transposase